MTTRNEATHQESYSNLNEREQQFHDFIRETSGICTKVNGKFTIKETKFLRNLVNLLRTKKDESDQGTWDEFQLIFALIPEWQRIIDI